jgi:hypothetical protein
MDEREFNNILDECLERVVFQGETLAQCLASYPEQAEELKPLLRTALSAKQAIAISPRPEFKERARYGFQAALRDIEQERDRGFFFGWRPQWVTVALSLLVFLLVGSGTVAAARNSMPDEPLYQVKMVTEAVQLTLTPSDKGKAELYSRLAGKRIAEIVKMADKGKPGQVERAAERLNEQLVAMAGLVAPVKPEAAMFMAPEPASEPPPASAPARAPQTEKAPLPAEEPQERSAALRAPPAPEKAAEAPAPSITVKEDTGDGGGEPEAGPDAELRATLVRRAAEQQEVLREVLETAPESVRPVLQEAVNHVAAAYERALGNLN